ncbi:MAG: hypothetical protein AABY58_06820, partial [Nitrospirota bacterium]
MQNETKTGGDNQEPGNAEVGYQMAIALWTYEGGLVWSKYNAMLVANSIVLALIGLTLDKQNLTRAFTVGMPIVGLLLCIAWFLLTKRGFDNYGYWILSARELEEKHFAASVLTVSRGSSLANGSKVKLTVDGRIRDYQMSWFSRLLKAEWISYLVLRFLNCMMLFKPPMAF